MGLREIIFADIPAICRVLESAWRDDRFSPGLVAEKIGRGEVGDGGGMVWEQEGEVEGWITVAHGFWGREPVAWVRLGAVARRSQRQGIGSALLAWAESWAQQQHCTMLRFFDCPWNYYTPGINLRYQEGLQFLQRRGYARLAENRNLLVTLEPSTLSRDQQRLAFLDNRLQEEGLVVRRLQEGDLPALVEMIQAVFSAQWATEVQRAAQHAPPAVHLALCDKRPVGFAAHNGNNFHTGSFGPMGVLPALRKKHLGELLLLRCLLDIRQMGFGQAIIPWVDQQAFYEKSCDVQRVEQYEVLGKKLDIF